MSDDVKFILIWGSVIASILCSAIWAEAWHKTEALKATLESGPSVRECGCRLKITASEEPNQ